MDIFELLRREHREIEDLLARLERAPGEAGFDLAGRRYLLDRLVLTASRHEAGEELTFWPEVRRRLGRDLVETGLQEERDARAVLDLLRVSRSDQEIIEGCQQLQGIVARHVGFEEQTVFPAMHRSTTPIWRTLAAGRFKVARRLGPTRPHPRGPVRPIGFVTKGAPAVVLDHLRDRRRRARRPPGGSEDGPRPDALEVLQRDHSELGALLSQIERQADPEERLVRETIRDFSIHDSIERQYLYPLIRSRVAGGHDLYARLMEEHGRIAGLAAEIDRYRFHDQARKSWLAEMTGLIRSHVEAEEGHVLPALRAHLTREELIDLGGQLESARATAPTRPHSHIAGSGGGARLSRRVVGPLDRARDLIRGQQTSR